MAEPDPAAALIRPARKGDLAALGRLGARLVHLHHAFDPQRFFLPDGDLAAGYARFLGGQLANERVVVLVAERDGEVVGYAYAGLEPRSWQELRDEAGFLHDVVVDEGARGRGIGAGLVEAAAAWLEARGAPRLLLWTAEPNAAAQRLFARLGFRRTMVEMARERRGR